MKTKLAYNRDSIGEFCKETGIRQRFLAEKIGISTSALYSLRKQSFISEYYADRIYISIKDIFNKLNSPESFNEFSDANGELLHQINNNMTSIQFEKLRHYRKQGIPKKDYFFREIDERTNLTPSDKQFSWAQGTLFSEPRRASPRSHQNERKIQDALTKGTNRILTDIEKSNADYRIKEYIRGFHNALQISENIFEIDSIYRTLSRYINKYGES